MPPLFTEMRPTPPMAFRVQCAPPPTPRTVRDETPDPMDWVRWEGTEVVSRDEEAKQIALAEVVRRIMSRNFVKHSRYLRATHTKSHAFVRGSMTVSPTLPPFLRHGLFSTPRKTYQVVARYSNASSHIQDDKQLGHRGLGIKVLGVQGPMMDGSSAGSQDLLFNNTRSSELYSFDAALDVFTLREEYFDDPDGLELQLRARRDSHKVLTSPDDPNTHLAASKMYTQVPMRYGPYVSKLSLHPASPAQLAIAEKSRPLPATADSTAHRKLLRAFFHMYPASYILRVQFASHSTQHSIDDTSVPWNSPWIEIARIDFPVQECYSDARRVWFEENVSLSPWNGLVAHQPLGALGRARKRAYAESRRVRAERNVEVVKLDFEPGEIPD